MRKTKAKGAEKKSPKFACTFVGEFRIAQRWSDFAKKPNGPAPKEKAQTMKI
jgi:hypothetical protein